MPPSQIPEFTEAKWGCMVDGCRSLITLIQRPRPLSGGGQARSPLEKFLAKCRELFCGSTKTGGIDSKHPHVDKINRLSGLFYDGTVHAGVYAMVDLWDHSYDEFFKFCKSNPTTATSAHLIGGTRSRR